jgi:hypothetical protein
MVCDGLKPVVLLYYKLTIAVEDADGIYVET